jgi:DNA repair protein RecO (recombination protein O)
MPIQEAEAVVLRQYPLAESDRIVVFFSREHGKLRAVAKAARKPRSRLGGILEPLNHVQVQYYLKEGTDLGRIESCDLLHPFLGQMVDLDRLYAFTFFAEIIQEIVQDNNPNHLLFRLFLSCLRAGEETGISEALVRYFEVWTLKLNGWLPHYDPCPLCGKCVKDVGFYVRLEAGRCQCSDCNRGGGIHIRPPAARALREIGALPPLEFVSRSLDRTVVRDLEKFTHGQFEWQMDRRFKSYPALREMFLKRQVR